MDNNNHHVDYNDMDKKVIRFHSLLSKAKHTLWVQDQKQVRVASLVNKSEQYYKQIKKREKDIVPRSALYLKYFNDNNNKNKSNNSNNNNDDDDDILPTRSELIAQLRKTNNVKNYNDFIGNDNDDDNTNKHNSNFYHYYTNDNNNNNHDDNHIITTNNNDNNTDSTITTGNGTLSINNIFAVKITTIFVKYVNHRHHLGNKYYSDNASIIDDNSNNNTIDNNNIIDNDTIDNDTINNDTVDNDTIDNDTINNDTIDNDTNDTIVISNSNNIDVVDQEQGSHSHTQQTDTNDTNDDSAHNDTITNEIENNTMEIDNNNNNINENNTNHDDNNNNDNNNNNDINNSIDAGIQPTPPPVNSDNKKKPIRSRKTIIMTNIDHKTPLSLALDYSGREYQRRRFWSLRSQKLESSLRLIGKKDIGLDDVHIMYEISKASNIAMMDTFIKLNNNNNHEYLQHLSCSWKYLTKEYLVAVNNCFEDDINPFVKEFVNDFRPLIQNDDAHFSHYMRSSSQHPEKFPVKAMLKAVTKKRKLHYRPLCTAGDVVLAIMELMDTSIFDSGYVQLPHVISGPFVRETDGFYRYTYKLNTPGEWRYLKKKLSSKNALYDFLCPNYCLDALFESKVIDAKDVDPKLKDQSLAAIKTLQSNFKEDDMLIEAVIDFEACTEMTYNVDHHNVYYPPDHTSFEPVDNLLIPNFVKRASIIDDSDNKKKATRKIYAKGDITYYRMLQVEKFHKVSRIAHYRRNAVVDFHGYTKLQEFNVLLKEEKRKIIETDKANFKKLKDSLDKFKKLSFEEYETFDEKLEEILERNNIFCFPKGWKNGKKKVEEIVADEASARTQQPYSLERMRAHELALDWFEEDFDDSDDDGVRVVDTDSDNDSEDTDKVVDDLTRSRMDAEKLKSSIVVDQTIIIESRKVLQENYDMGKEDNNALIIKPAIVIKTVSDLNLKKATKTVQKSGILFKEESSKNHQHGIQVQQKKGRPEITTLTTSVAYVPLTYITPNINNLIKPETNMNKREKLSSKAHAKHIGIKNKSFEKVSSVASHRMNIQSFIDLWVEICDNEYRILQELESEDVGKTDFRHPTPHTTILSSAAFDAASKLSHELIFDGKTVVAKVNEIKMNTMKSQAMDAVAASQRMERFHLERKERAISIYKQDCDDALRGLLKGMNPGDITAILKAIRRKKVRRKKRKVKVIIPKKQDGGYDNEDGIINVNDDLEYESDDGGDDDDDGDDNNDYDYDNSQIPEQPELKQEPEQPQEVDLSYLLASLDEPAQASPKPKKFLRMKKTSTNKYRSSLFDNTLSSVQKMKSRVDRMTKAMKKMLAKIVFNINISNIDGDLVEEESKALKSAQEEVDRLRKQNAYRLHLLPKSTSSTSTVQVDLVGGKLWGDDLTEQLLANRFANDRDDNDSREEPVIDSDNPSLVQGAQLFEQSVFSDSSDSDLNEDDPFTSKSQMSLIGEIINEPKVLIARTYDPYKIKKPVIQNTVNHWIEIARDNVVGIRTTTLDLSDVSRNSDKYDGSGSYLGISSIHIASTISKLTSESYYSGTDENSTIGPSFWKLYEDSNKNRSTRPPTYPQAEQAQSRQNRKENKSTVHNPDISNLIIVAKGAININNDTPVIIEIPPFTPVNIAGPEKVLFPRNPAKDAKGLEPNAIENINNKKNRIICDNGGEWIPLESINDATDNANDKALDNSSVFDIPKYSYVEGPPPLKIPQTVDDFLQQSVTINDNIGDKIIDKSKTTSVKKKSTIFSGIHSLARNSNVNSNINASEIDYGINGKSIPIPQDKNNFLNYYSQESYDDEYKLYLEEEDKFSGYEIGLIISHYDTNVVKSGLQKHTMESEEPDETVQKMRKLMADCFHDKLFAVGKRFEPKLEDIYERSESEIEFGLGLDSSILDVISTSLYKDNDKDFMNENNSIIDDSISAITAANASSVYANHFEESEFSSLLLIDKIKPSTTTVLPKRPSSNYKRSYNFIRKNIKDTEIDGGEELTPKFSVHVASINSDNLEEIQSNVPSVYLNKYLKQGILQESQRVVRDITPTLKGRYFENKRKLITSTRSDDDCKVMDEDKVTDDDKLVDNDKVTINDQRPKSRGNKSPIITHGHIRSPTTTPTNETSSVFNYSPPNSPSSAASNKYLDILAIGIKQNVQLRKVENHELE